MSILFPAQSGARVGCLGLSGGNKKDGLSLCCVAGITHKHSLWAALSIIAPKIMRSCRISFHALRLRVVCTEESTPLPLTLKALFDALSKG